MVARIIGISELEDVKLRDIWMMQGGDELCLVRKASHEVRLLSQVGIKYLNSDIAA